MANFSTLRIQYFTKSKVKLNVLKNISLIFIFIFVYFTTELSTKTFFFFLINMTEDHEMKEQLSTVRRSLS